MAKDPAFLFYPNDWMGGTQILSRHQKGCYLDLLVAQFNNGPLSLDTIKAILGQDQAAWTVLSRKFKQTGEGLWYNERLETEKNRRKNFIEKQKENGKKGGRKPTLNPTLNPNSTNIENENGIRDEVGIGSFGKFENLLSEIEIGSAIEFISITANKTLNENEIREYFKAFIIHSEGKSYNKRSEKTQHFRTWLKIQIENKKNGTTTNRETPEPKLGTSEARTNRAKRW